jgi:hypothetical protein
METVLVTAIVLIASIGVVVHLIKKFRAPGKNRCGGGCCSCKKPVDSQEKNNNAIDGGD